MTQKARTPGVSRTTIASMDRQKEARPRVQNTRTTGVHDMYLRTDADLRPSTFWPRSRGAVANFTADARRFSVRAIVLGVKRLAAQNQIPQLHTPRCCFNATRDQASKPPSSCIFVRCSIRVCAQEGLEVESISGADANSVEQAVAKLAES